MNGALRARLGALRADVAPPAPDTKASRIAPLREMLARIGRTQDAREQGGGRERRNVASHGDDAGPRHPLALLPDAADAGGWAVRVATWPHCGVTGMHPGIACGSIDAAAALAAASSLLSVRPGLSRAPDRVLLLDLETTGLRGSGTLAWCVGLLSFGAGELVVEQHVLADPAAEADMLAAVDERIAAADVVVTYNGRCFDLPLLESRRVLARRRPLAPARDLDLLPPARRLLAPGDARLVTLERMLGRDRGPDIAGEDIPRAWFDWLVRGEPEDARAAVDHNCEDLLSMAAVLSWLLALASGAPDAVALARPLGLAELRLADGDRPGALAAVDSAIAESATDMRRRARLLQRLRGRTAARGEWQRLVDGGDVRPDAWEGLAKILEHDERDPESALALVMRARAHLGRGAVAARLDRRLARLEARVAARRARVLPP